MNLRAASTNSLEQHWMPFTANRDFKASPRLITRSEGMYLWNQNGERLIDGSSGLFNVAAGHGRREIADAVHAQMLQNDYTAAAHAQRYLNLCEAGAASEELAPGGVLCNAARNYCALQQRF